MNDALAEDTTAERLKEALWDRYHWAVGGNWSVAALEHLLKTGAWLETLLAQLPRREPQAWIRRYLKATFIRPGWMGQLTPLKGKSFVFPKSQVRLQPVEDLSQGSAHIVHELGHVLDNALGGVLPATFVGGGAADRMVAAVGGKPERCVPRFVPMSDYVEKVTPLESWLPREAYGNTCVAEDFAEAFVWTLTNPQRVPTGRRAWMETFLKVLE